MPGNHAFKARLAQYQQRVDAALDKCLPKNDPPEHNLAEAIRYSVLGGGGKRMRPAMVYAAGEAVGIERWPPRCPGLRGGNDPCLFADSR